MVVETTEVICVVEVATRGMYAGILAGVLVGAGPIVFFDTNIEVKDLLKFETLVAIFGIKFRVRNMPKRRIAMRKTKISALTIVK